MAAIAAPIIGGIAGGLFGKGGAKKAARAQERANQAAIAEQRRQYDTTRADLMPWLEKGGNALTRLDNFSEGDMSDFQTSPDYEFTRKEGTRNIGNSWAAKGGAFSGNALRSLDEFNSGLASQQVGNWWNRQAGLAGVGQTAGTNIGQFGANAANNVGNALINQGDARASGIVGGTNALLGGLSGALDAWQYFRRPQMGASMAHNYGGPMYGGYA
jgi:hypothetical protein